MTSVEVKQLVANSFATTPKGLLYHQGTLWIANNGTGTLTNYDLHGQLLNTVTLPANYGSVPAAPTGLVINPSKGFVISTNDRLISSLILVASENSVIYGYHPLLYPNQGFRCTDRSLVDPAPSYHGLAMVGDFLYATDFRNNKIDVFDYRFILQSSYSFLDTSMPSEFAPSNITVINGQMYVSYALQAGGDSGYINVFDTQGDFVRRLVTQGHLNSPWGMVINPDNTKELLVSNVGDGTISIFSHRSGRYKGQIQYHPDGPKGPDSLEPLIINKINGLVALGHRIYYAGAPSIGRLTFD